MLNIKIDKYNIPLSYWDEDNKVIMYWPRKLRLDILLNWIDKQKLKYYFKIEGWNKVFIEIEMWDENTFKSKGEIK